MAKLQKIENQSPSNPSVNGERKSILSKGKEYATYEEAVKDYKPSDKWLEFEGTPEKFNIAHECVDRYIHLGLALSIKKSTGDTQHATYRELSRRSNQLANWLTEHEMRMGDSVLFLQDKSIDLYANIFGVIKAGGAATYSAPILGGDSIKHIIKVLQPKLVVFDDTTRKEIASVAPVGITSLSEDDISDAITNERTEFESQTTANDLAMIHFTSGTTGMPKPVKLPHKAFVNLAPILKFAIGLRLGDTHFHTSSTNITIGNIGALSFGAHVCTYSGPFDAERVLETFEEMKVDTVEMPATAYRKILLLENMVNRFDISVRTLAYSMESMDMSTFLQIKRVFGKEPYGQYGSTEVGPVLANFAGFKDWKIKPLSLGKPYPGQAVAIIDDNEKVLSSNQRGYIAIKLMNRWRKVGDYGFEDEDGYFWFVSRIDDVIKSAGYRLGPEEIENVINTHEAVVASAVVGVSDDIGGQRIKAFIELKPNFNYSKEQIEHEIQSLVRTKVGRHAYPKEVVIIPNLPRTEDGKIKRKELIERRSY